MNRYYIVRWYNSNYYTSVNDISYVKKLFNTSRPQFYNFLVYELIETNLTFKQLTLLLPFDRNLNKVSRSLLSKLELAKMKYHLKHLREYLNFPT